MSDLTLNDGQQRALGQLLAADPVPGDVLPPAWVLEQVGVLIPCGGIRAEAMDPDGFPVTVREIPHPAGAGVFDVVVARHARGTGGEVRVSLTRSRHGLSDAEQRILRLVRPPLERLLRPPPLPHLPTTLTVQERHVLQHVAEGLTNAEIAEQMSIAPCTVRKHLEHAFPKLGVSNRLAAAIAFLDQARPAPEARGRVDIFA